MRTASLLAILAVVAVAACDAQPTSSPPASSDMPSASPISAEWAALELPGARGRRFADGVIADADGFVVYGNVKGKPMAWVSPDAAEWDAVRLGGGEGTPSRAAASASATVLIGVGSTSRCAHPSGEFLWRREAGETDWEVVPFDRPLFCAGGFPTIAARDESFMVAGMGTGDQPFAWRSPDGRDWADVQTGLPGDAPPWLLTATGEAFIVLGRGARTEVRTNADGGAWVSVPAPPVAPAFNDSGPGMEPAALLATRAGVLAVYQADDASLVSAWLQQADGSWTQVALGGLEPGDWISGGTVVDGVACLFLTRVSHPSAVLVSRDLQSWSDLSIPEVGAVLGLASFGERTVLVAATTNADGEQDATLLFVADGLPLSGD